MDLKGKHAIVTGVSRGIGKSVTRQLLDAGASVAGWGLHQPGYSHDNLFFVQTDISDLKQVESAFEKSRKRFGSDFDILVNNAGLGYATFLEELEPDKWHKQFDVNVHGLYYVTRTVLPQMKAREYGHIINIASIAGTTGIPQMSAYCGTKHAVRGISHALYKEVRAWNVKVSCIYPGSTNTDFFNNISGVDTADFMMKPDEIAQTILHLLQTPDNFLTVDVEVRPLKTPKHKKPGAEQ